MAERKPAVLVVLPYGMCFRNIVMNEGLWQYLIGKYEVDVQTPLHIKDAAALGIRHVFHPPQGPLARLARRANGLMMGALRFLDATRFLMRGHLGGYWAANYARLSSDLKRGLWLLLGAIRAMERYWPCSWIIKALNACPVFHPGLSILRKHRYAFVVVGHTNEDECILAARQANRLKIPVVAVVMGVDNIMHGLLQFVPDLLLLWGQEQLDQVRTFQMPLKPELASTRCEVVGSLTYDTYLTWNGAQGGGLVQADGSRSADETILFAAYPTDLLPDQLVLCDMILEFLEEERVPATLLIRLRAGTDPREWEELVGRHPNRVRLQRPYGATYDKSDHVPAFDVEDAFRDIDLFVQTMRGSTLQILPTLSTMYLDGLLFGVPSVVTMFAFSDPDGAIPHRDLKNYIDFVGLHAAFRNLKTVAMSRDEFLGFLRRFFVARDRAGLLPEGVFEYRAALSRDGRCGQRAASAIDRLSARRVKDSLAPMAQAAHG